MKKLEKILTIDDEKYIRRNISDYLEDIGYKTIEAKNGIEGLKMFHTENPDLVLCDIKMPGLNGLEVLETITRESPETPVIMISGTADIKAAVQTVRLGAWDYILKPILDMETLGEAIENIRDRIKSKNEEKENLVDNIRSELSEESKILKNRARDLEKVIVILKSHLQSDKEARQKILMLSSAVDNEPERIILTDLEGRIEYVNDSLIELGKFKDRKELIGNTIYSYVDDKTSDDIGKDILPSLLEEGSWQGEINLGRKDGTKFLVEVVCTLIRNQFNEPSYVKANYRDISERKKLEENYLEQESKYKAIFESSNDAIILTKNNIIIDCNPRSTEIFQISRKGILETDIHELLNSCKSDEYDTKEFQKAVDNLLQHGDKKLFEWTLKRSDGSDFIAEISLVKLESLSEDFFLVVIRDVSEHRSLEKQLQQAQRLEAVGRLAGGVAHDFNNLITAIAGNAELTKMKLDKEDPLQENLDEILNTSLRAADLTRQLLLYSRKQVPEFKITNLNVVLNNIDRMLRRIIGEDIFLETKMFEDLWEIKADPSQLEQVIVNLCVNARDAMPDGGELNIETDNVTLDKTYVSSHLDIEPGDYVMISVTDSGTGIDQVTQKKIFEPFFTTKELGKGTGLGLSNVLNIVKQAKGSIWVYSEPGMGTTFKIYYPSVGNKEILEKKEKLTGKNLKGKETILVVEDEESVRKIAVKTLSKFGYSVIETSNPEEAIDIIIKEENKIDLVISDVVMPGMSGTKLAEAIRTHTKDAKILLMSGYTDDSLVHHGVLSAKIPFIQKPFRTEKLVRMIRDILDEK